MAIANYLDRVFSWICVFAGLAAVTHWIIGSYASPLIAVGMQLGLAALLGQKLVFHWNEVAAIERLGGHAPAARSGTPFNVGILAQALWYFNRQRNAEMWEKLFARAPQTSRAPYTTETVTLGQRIVFTADEENIKAVLATQFGAYGKGQRFRDEWKDFLGLSIFTTDGSQWHESRQLLRPQFIKDRVSDLATFETHVGVLLPLLEGPKAVRFDDLAYRYTLDAAADFLLGGNVGSLEKGETDFSRAFAEIQRVQALKGRAGPAGGLVPRKTFYESLDVLNRFLDHFIDEALALPREELEAKSRSDQGYTFLHAIAQYTRDRALLRDQLVAVLLAGRDTTAVTLSWLFYELSRQPRVVRKIRREIIDRVGLDRVPTYDDLKAMRYLQHAISETLRLYPVIPFNVRIALQDTTLPRGGGPDGTEPIGVLKDTSIAYSPLVLQRRTDIYPDQSAGFPDPLTFCPERWENWTPKSWTYIPFNGGPRICIGQQFALTELAYTTTRILQEFASVEDRNDAFPGTKADIVLSPAAGVHVAFSREEKFVEGEEKV